MREITKIHDPNIAEEAYESLKSGDVNTAESRFGTLIEKSKDQIEKSKFDLGYAYRSLGNLSFSNNSNKEIAHLRNSVEQQPLDLDSWRKLGQLYERNGKYDDAIICYNNIIKIATTANLKNELAIGYQGKALSLKEKCDYKSAIELHTSALELFREIGDVSGIASQTGNIAECHRLVGNLNKAETMTEESLKLSTTLNDKGKMASQTGNLGLIRFSQGKLEEAIRLHNNSLSINMELGRMENQSSDYANIGMCHVQAGSLDEAETMYIKSLDLASNIGAKSNMAAANQALGYILLQKGRGGEAERYLVVARRISEEIGHKPLLARTLFVLGLLYRAHEKPPGCDCLYRAKILANDVGDIELSNQIEESIKQLGC